MSNNQHMQELYDEMLAIEASIEESRARTHQLIKERVEVRDKIRAGMSPGEVVEVNHSADEVAVITNTFVSGLPETTLTIRRQNERGTQNLVFGTDPEGEKITRRRM